MVNGALNTVFQSTLPNKVRLKLLPPKKYVPELDPLDAQEPLPDGDYLMFRSKLEMPGQEMSHLDVLIPVELANMFDPPSEAPAEAEDSGTSDAAAAEPGSNDESEESTSDAEPAAPAGVGIDSIVVLEDNELERQYLVDLVAFTEFQVVEGSLNADIKELFSGRNVRLVLIGSQDADDRELAVCIKVNAIRQDFPPPIIMSAECWTRTAVLKALKYGARDIIIKPFNSDDVVAKVRRFCTLAAA
jgi:CheY-like chemotaxis protein